MVERSVFPIYGNVFTFFTRNNRVLSIPYLKPQNFTLRIAGIKYYDSIRYSVDIDSGFLKRNYASNRMDIIETGNKFVSQKIPFHVNYSEIKKWLRDTVAASASNEYDIYGLQEGSYLYDEKEKKITDVFRPETSINNPLFNIIHSQPSDSLFKPMMHRSDNFFAEQTLLMVSNEHLGYMNDEKIIDTLLKLDLKDVPQKPKWVDGSGLSRYNLFTPQSFVYILNKMRTEFGWDRLKNILPTGGAGTLSAYYKNDSGFIYAKTGTLSNNCALSGVLITQNGKLLIFSVLANNYQTGATPVRKAVEKFLLDIRTKY